MQQLASNLRTVRIKHTTRIPTEGNNARRSRFLTAFGSDGTQITPMAAHEPIGGGSISLNHVHSLKSQEKYKDATITAIHCDSRRRCHGASHHLPHFKRPSVEILTQLYPSSHDLVDLGTLLLMSCYIANLVLFHYLPSCSSGLKSHLGYHYETIIMIKS